MTELHKLWIKQLRKYPKRQITGQLGRGTPRFYNACCLGELLVCKHRLEKKKLPFHEGYIVDVNKELDQHDAEMLGHSFKELGLRSDIGALQDVAEINGKKFFALAQMNDYGVSWPEIADYIEQNPENVFAESE